MSTRRTFFRQTIIPLAATAVSIGHGMSMPLPAAAAPAIPEPTSAVPPWASISGRLKLACDPVAFVQSCGFQPDPWQEDYLRSEASDVMTLCTRQAGKSTTTAGGVIHDVIYTPGALVLIVAASMRQSQELFRKAVGFYRTSPTEDRPMVVSETMLTLTLANGSRIVSLPGRDDGTIRGYSSVHRVVLDEASRVPDTLYYALRPMLAVSRSNNPSSGKLNALTTPWGKRGWFHREWEEGGSSWHRIKVTAEECPRISPEFLAQERKSMGPLMFASEYMCEFVDTVDQMFRSEDIDGALSDVVEPLFNQALGRLVW